MVSVEIIMLKSNNQPVEESNQKLWMALANSTTEQVGKTTAAM